MISRYSDIKFIFCYNLHAVPLAKLIKVAKKKKISLVADCTEWYENKISLNPVKLIKCVDTFLCMRCFQKKCDGMIAISSYLENYYKKHIRNIIVLPPLVDLSDEKYVFHHPKEKNDVSTFIYSGSPSAAKESLGEVVECFDNITDIDYKLIIVGVTIEQFASIYGSTPKNNKIEFCGRISHREAVNAVRQSDYAIVIRPRTRVTMAGFPTKFAEAVSVGTAVIANDISDLKLYLKDGKNGYLISSEKIAEEFKRILLSDKNVVIESDTFDYKKYTEQFEIFLDTVI